MGREGILILECSMTVAGLVGKTLEREYLNKEVLNNY